MIVSKGQATIVKQTDLTSSNRSRNAPKTESEWRKFWIDKFDRTAAWERIDLKKRTLMIEIITNYLQNNPGIPYDIKPVNLEFFIKQATNIEVETVQFFFKRIAISEKHLDIIEKIVPSICEPNETDIEKKQSQNKPAADVQSGKNENNCLDEIPQSQQQSAFPQEERIELLNKLKLEIKARNLSDCTLRHYNGAVSRFMDWLTPESAANWSTAFKEHLVWLREDRKLAPNTVNQYAASIAFFMVEVLELEPGADILIRMKTGKPLPRVHSLEKITEIINAPTNFTA